ncbi:hypothetical protein KCU90_g73, partial [Aureobasidium melanogenum]
MALSKGWSPHCLLASRFVTERLRRFAREFWLSYSMDEQQQQQSDAAAAQSSDVQEALCRAPYPHSMPPPAGCMHQSQIAYDHFGRSVQGQ